MKKLKVIGNDAIFRKAVINEVYDELRPVDLCEVAKVNVRVGYVGGRMYEVTGSTSKRYPLRYTITGDSHNIVTLFISGKDCRFQRSGDVRMEIAYSIDGDTFRKASDSYIFTYLTATEYALALHADNAQMYLGGYIVRTYDAEQSETDDEEDGNTETARSIVSLGTFGSYREGEYNLIKAIREDVDAHDGKITRNIYKFCYIEDNVILEYLFDVVNFSDVYNKEVNTPSVSLIRKSYDGRISVVSNIWLCDATEQHYEDADGNTVYLVGVYREKLEDYNIIGTRGVFYCNWEWFDITDGQASYKYDVPTETESQPLALAAVFANNLKEEASYYIRNIDNETYSQYIYDNSEFILIDANIGVEPSVYTSTTEDFERRISALEDGCLIPDNTPVTDIDMGNIPKGTDISGWRFVRFALESTHVEYAPVWADASASIAAKAGTIVEVGTIVPSLSESNFNIGGTAAKATGGMYVANGGAATNSIICNVQGVGEARTEFGNVVYTLSRAYAAGSDVVKSTKGNPTDKTAANATTLLSKASANANIDATDKTIKAITKTATCTIAFVDAFYANTAAIGTMAKLPLTSANSIELDYPAETASAKHSFSLPATYQDVQIYIWNAVSNGGEWQLYAGTFTQSSETKTLSDGETTKAYTKYTRNDGTNPATKFKVTFTKA